MVSPRQITSRVALSDPIEKGVKARRVNPFKWCSQFSLLLEQTKISKDFRELAVFIIFKEIIEYLLENCLSCVAVIEGSNHCYEFLEASWVSDGM